MSRVVKKLISVYNLDTDHALGIIKSSVVIDDYSGCWNWSKSFLVMVMEGCL